MSSCPYSRSNVICVVAASGIILMQAILLYKEHAQCEILSKELEHEHVKREADRKGRIRSQQKAREKVQEGIQENGGHSMAYIGHIRSPFPDRRGTPRQPLLVPAAHGRIVFNKHLIQKDHFQELAQFSHVFVLFVFHENTDTDSKHVGKVCNAKISPPRLGGKKVGCLSTRSPHRPNPIGLSVCEVLHVGENYIDLKSIDFVDGTPVLDIKPYIPYDVVRMPEDNDTANLTLVKNHASHGEGYLPMAHSADGSALQNTTLRVPDWIREADVPMRTVEFTSDAQASLHKMYAVVKTVKTTAKMLRFCKDAAHAVELITQVLRQDVRGVKQGRVSQEQDGDTHQSYMVRLDCMSIDVSFLVDKVIVVSIKFAKSDVAEK